MRSWCISTVVEFTFAPSRLTRIDELTAYGGLAFEKRVRVCEIDSQRTASDVGAVQIANGRHGSVMILRGSDRKDSGVNTFSCKVGT